jgi:hypothetical protein
MPVPLPDDCDLLRRIAGGDDAAFYRCHLDAVVAFFRRRVPEPERRDRCGHGSALPRPS